MRTLKKTSRTSLRKMIAMALRSDNYDTRIELYNKYGCFIAVLDKFDRHYQEETLTQCIDDIMWDFVEYDDHWGYSLDNGRYNINVAFTLAELKY